MPVPSRYAQGFWLALAVVPSLPFPMSANAEQSYYVTHDLGFSVPVAVEAAVETTDDGFLIVPDGRVDVRTPITITVGWTVQPGAISSTALERSREVGGITAQYGLSSVTAGSGGTEYELTASRPLCGGTLEVRQHQQQEFGPTPDFLDAWHIVELARCAD